MKSNRIAMLRALHDPTPPTISEYRRNATAGVDLKDRAHCFMADWALVLLDVLLPRRPAEQFVTLYREVEVLLVRQRHAHGLRLSITWQIGLL